MSDSLFQDDLAAPLEQPFSLQIGGPEGGDLFVERLSGREELSRPYEVRVVARAPGIAAETLAAWIEAPCVVTLATASGARRIHGIVARASGRGPTGRGEEVVQIKVVPRLARLALRHNSRIFQERTPQEIVSEVLDEHGVAHRFEMFDAYPRRAYATQYEETDLAFVSRILAEVGVYYRFEAPSSAGPEASEILVLCDGRRYEPILESAVVPFRALASRGGLSGDAEHVSAFSIGRRAAPTSSVRRTFDFRRPLLRLESRSGDRDPAKEWFEHDGEPEPSEHEMAGEDARLEQLRRKALTVSGQGTCRRFQPGRRFTLAGHETAGFDGDYVITEVRHEARAAEQAGGLPVYENTFRGVRATERFRPRRPQRHVRHVIETAIVTGPEGAEIHADEHGRVKVRFAWDRGRSADERSSVWIRTSQIWSGQLWGAQFLPRVGMEVLVGFLQGDPDQPVILGCVPNAVQPLPFTALTRSGIVTRSTPGGKLRNEVSFEDRRGAEELRIAAGRDLTVTSTQDAALSIGGQSRAEVLGDSDVSIGGRRTERVSGDAQESIDGSLAEHVTLGWTRSAGTSLAERAGGDYSLSVGKGYALSVAGIASSTVGTPDRPSVSSAFVHGDQLTRASESIRIVADKAISLICGESRIDLTPEGVRITALKVDVAGKKTVSLKGAGPSLSLSDTAQILADKVQIFAEKGQLLLDKHARMNGETVKLNCSDEQAPPLKEDGAPVETEPFRTKLTDHAFAPYAGKTYHLVADGLRFEGKTTAEGLVDKAIPKGAKAIEITVWLGDYPEGERRVFHIRKDNLPPTSVEGAQARLQNLGYLTGAASGALDEATRAALVSFQMDTGLPPKGDLDAATAQKLQSMNGS